MIRTNIMVLGVLALLIVAVLAGCGGKDTGPRLDRSDLAYSWSKTRRVVANVAETPLTHPMAYTLNTNGTYTGVGAGTYTESGTWALAYDGVADFLMIHMTANSDNSPAADFTAMLALDGATHFTLTYDADNGGPHLVRIVETYTRQ